MGVTSDHSTSKYYGTSTVALLVNLLEPMVDGDCNPNFISRTDSCSIVGVASTSEPESLRMSLLVYIMSDSEWLV